MLLMNESLFFERKKLHNINFRTFKLPASTRNIKWLTKLKICLLISVYDYLSIGWCSDVYIFHKGIIVYVLCGYEVQMRMYFFFLRESPSKNGALMLVLWKIWHNIEKYRYLHMYAALYQVDCACVDWCYIKIYFAIVIEK